MRARSEIPDRAPAVRARLCASRGLPQQRAPAFRGPRRCDGRVVPSRAGARRSVPGRAARAASSRTPRRSSTPGRSMTRRRASRRCTTRSGNGGLRPARVRRRHFEPPPRAGRCGRELPTAPRTMEEHIRALWPAAHAARRQRRSRARRSFRCPARTSCPAAASARSTTGTRTSRCSVWSRAVAPTSSQTCSTTSRIWSTTVGHVPNGNRTYYLSRSQPPYFARDGRRCTRRPPTRRTRSGTSTRSSASTRSGWKGAERSRRARRTAAS